MPDPSSPAPPTDIPGAASAPIVDPVDELVAYLTGPEPRLVLVRGVPGAGKSALLRSVATRGPPARLLIAYRDWTASREGSTGSGDGGEVQLLLLDPRTPGLPPTDRRAVAGLPTLAALSARGGRRDGMDGGLPLPLRLAVEGLAERQGIALIDSWDRSTESTLGPASRVARTEVTLSSREFAGLLHSLPVSSLLVAPDAAAPDLTSLADGVVQLDREAWEGPLLRQLTIPKLRGRPPREEGTLYTLAGGGFRTAEPLPSGFQPPIALPESDPAPRAPGLWPGSRAFHDTFGRLPPHSLSAVQVPPTLPAGYAHAICFPLAAHVLRLGGRVIWVPPSAVSPATLCADLRTALPRAALVERLRILSPAGADEPPVELASTIVRVRPPEAGSESAAPSVRPAFEAAFQFLSKVAPGAPALFLVAFDGLQALARIAGVRYDPATFPLLVANYRRIPGFYGFGISPIRDPLATSLDSGVQLLLRMEEHLGRPVIYGLRPPTAAYLLEWGAGDPAYRLARVA